MGFGVADIIKDKEYEDYLLIAEINSDDYCTVIMLYSAAETSAGPLGRNYTKSYLEKYFQKVA